MSRSVRKIPVPNGLLKSIDNGVSKSDYAYDSRNLLTSETQTLAGQSARVISYQHDADGLRSGVTYPSAQALEYAWTARAQLLSVSAAGPPPLATYSYDKAGRNTALAHEHDRRLVGQPPFPRPPAQRLFQRPPAKSKFLAVIG